MFNELKVNNIALPRPDGDLEFVSEKLKTEYETEAGTTQVSVRRESRLTIAGTYNALLLRRQGAILRSEKKFENI